MISISLCMIVKDEERVLERCLKSFAPLVEEIVVVDTGSKDATREIAARYTDKIYDFSWIGDFAAARNFAFSKTSCDYIYSADADEFIDEDNSKKFMALKEAMDEQVEMVQMWYVNRHELRTTDNFEKDLRPKLFKRLRSFVWIDPVHESVRLDPVVFDSDIEILHMPESRHSGRDFGIFMNKLSNGEKLSRKLMHMYAQELFIAGADTDFKDAAPFFENLIYDAAYGEDERMEAYCVLARAARLNKDVNGFFKWALKNISIKPCAEMCCEIGRYYFEAGDYEEASVWFINAHQETEAILKADAAEKEPVRMLAACYEHLATEHPEMKEAFLKMAVSYRSQLT